MPRHLIVPDETNLILPPEKNRLLSLDEDSVHKTLAVTSWWSVIERFAAQGLSWNDWPDLTQEMARMTVRFTRPDGSSVFEPPGPRPERLAILRSLADPGIATISNWWSRGKSKSVETGPPPLPAFGSETRPIAMLRADWSKDGDFLAVDARNPASQKVELSVGGQPILGPDWPGATSRARMRLWKTSYLTDCAEWSSGAGASKIVRTVVLFRGRKMALIAEERSGRTDPMILSLADRVEAKIVAETQTIALKSAGGGPSARVIPFGLNETSGTFVAEGRTLSLDSPSEAVRRWIPLLVSWDMDRNRQGLKWRPLTVSANSKVCKPGVAFAARVAWGQLDQFVIYRSLAKPAMRSFLGYQTSARFLVGLFNEKGNVVPLIQVD